MLAVGDGEKERIAFVQQAINDHKASAEYRLAIDADLYYRHLNPTIMRAQKYVYDLAGKAHVDIWSANNKIPCRYYFYFVTQEVQYLLGNGVSFNEDGTKDRLGNDFDTVVQKAATEAINGGVSFCFWNLDHLEMFSLREFVPLYDEENGSLSAGIRFWQIAENKPLHATLYELNGYTGYVRDSGKEMVVKTEKRAYQQIIKTSDVGGTEIYDGDNYPSFPIIPLFNINKQSELVGSRETLDAYDLTASALVNNIDDANLIYWVIKNAGGMDDVDDMKFIQRLKTVHVAHTDDNTDVDAHTVDVPFEASETTLKRLRSELFDDFMALDTKEIANGATTATQIRAAYEPLNSKTDMLEYQVTDFISRLLALVGIEDKPTYTRSRIVNNEEEVRTLLSAATVLPEDYVTRKVLEILGDIDRVDEVLAQKEVEDMGKYSLAESGEEE